jgi:hypothetical protein
MTPDMNDRQVCEPPPQTHPACEKSFVCVRACVMFLFIFSIFGCVHACGKRLLHHTYGPRRSDIRQALFRNESSANVQAIALDWLEESRAHKLQKTQRTPRSSSAGIIFGEEWPQTFRYWRLNNWIGLIWTILVRSYKLALYGITTFVLVLISRTTFFILAYFGRH